jgi:uncharacterized protein (DUF2237 family)
MMALNVFGEELIICSNRPLTGFYRDGCCNTGDDDLGMHTVCAVMTDEFLEFSRSRGNDLSTAVPQYGFPGLKAGDRWCLCALRWVEAWQEGKAPLIMLEATHEKTLDFVPLKVLVQYAWKDTSTEASSKA